MLIFATPLTERFLVANVVAEASAFDSWTPRGPAQPYQHEMLRICAEGRLDGRLLQIANR